MQAYASGKDVVVVDGHLTHIQTVQGDIAIKALHCSEGTGKIAVAWESDVVIFNPEPHEESSEASSADLSAPLTNVVSMKRYYLCSYLGGYRCLKIERKRDNNLVPSPSPHLHTHPHSHTLTHTHQVT